MKESVVRHRLLAECRERGLWAFPIESGLVYQGIPDVCLHEAGSVVWVECKHVAAFPKRPGTRVAADLLRPAQGTWFRNYRKTGGAGGFIFVRVGEVYFLYHSEDALDINDWVKKDYFDKCLWLDANRGTDWDGFFMKILNIPVNKSKQWLDANFVRVNNLLTRKENREHF